MNLSDAHWIIPLLEGVKNGRTLQWYDSVNWRDTDKATFADHPSRYRLKPTTKTYWILEDQTGDHNALVFYSKKDAENYLSKLTLEGEWEIIEVKTD